MRRERDSFVIKSHERIISNDEVTAIKKVRTTSYLLFIYKINTLASAGSAKIHEDPKISIAPNVRRGRSTQRDNHSLAIFNQVNDNDEHQVLYARTITLSLFEFRLLVWVDERSSYSLMFLIPRSFFFSFFSNLYICRLYPYERGHSLRFQSSHDTVSKKIRRFVNIPQGA